MDKARINKRLKNLKKVKGIVEIAKIDTIKKIAKSNNIKNHHYEMARTSQQIINYSNSLNKFKKRVSQQKQSKQENSLWIFITLPSSLIKISYTKYERIILKNANKKNDAIIPIGDPAITFAKENQFKIFTQFDNLLKTNLKLSSLLLHVIKSREFNNIFIISQASKISKTFYKIYPFYDIKYDRKKMKKKSFYYSLTDTMEQISYNYIRNIISGIYQESYRNFYVEKLARHESSLKNIDDKIYELKMSLVKNQRKEETEEIIQVIQSVKRR